MPVQETTLGREALGAVQGAEADLVAELRAGSVEAFNYVIAVYHPPLYHLVYRMLGDPADAADTLQEVFLKVFRAAAHFEGKSSLKTWLYRIAVHEASNYRRWWHRHKKQETSLESEDSFGRTLAERLRDPGASPLGQAMRAEAQQEIARGLAALPDPYRTTLILRDIEGFSYAEMAEILEVREGTVKSRLVRGRELLRQYMVRRPQMREALSTGDGREVLPASPSRSGPDDGALSLRAEKVVSR